MVEAVLELNCSLVSINNLSKLTTHLIPLTLLKNLGYIFDEHLTILTRSHLSPNHATAIFISFALSLHTSIPKQPPQSPLLLFTPSLTTATLFITISPSLRSPGCNRLRILLPPSHITPILRSLYWLKITEHIDPFTNVQSSDNQSTFLSA